MNIDNLLTVIMGGMLGANLPGSILITMQIQRPTAFAVLRRRRRQGESLQELRQAIQKQQRQQQALVLLGGIIGCLAGAALNCCKPT